jgi:membrane carboxypeptidase/penicillin-binding protein PbpC
MEQNQPTNPGGQPGQGNPQSASSADRQIQVKVSDKILRGQYANLVQVAHTSEEFVLDFMTVLPPAGQLTARILLSPSHFKRFVRTLQENLQRYEDQFGTIQLAVVPDQQIGFKVD